MKAATETAPAAAPPRKRSGGVLDLPFFLGLFGVYSVLFLLAANRSQSSPASALPSLAFGMVISLLLFGLLRLLLKPGPRLYLVTLVANLAFFSYGHLFNLVDGRRIGTLLVGRHALFLPVYLVVCAAALGWAVKVRELPAGFFRGLNALLALLCLVQLAQLGGYYGAIWKARGRSASLPAVSPAAAAPGPDIYYIILDGFVREDLMREGFQYQDYSLPRDLQALGFVIPRCAFSNYNSTSVSIASALNFDYLDQLGIQDSEVNTDVNDPPVLYDLLHGNRVVSLLRQQGYQFVSFRGFFPLNDFTEADTYYNFYKNPQGLDLLGESQFRAMFIDTTLLRLPSELYASAPEKYPFVPDLLATLVAPDASVFSSRSYKWYRQHLYTFEKLETVPALPGKKFVYAHLYTTHQPYVFHEDGSLLWPISEDNAGYLAAARYTSQRILETLRILIKDSPIPPVIILQADHGQGAGLDRHKILNAYYLPGASDLVYDTITPVNTFRLVLDHYFHMDYPLLEDKLLVSEKGKADYVTTPVSCPGN